MRSITPALVFCLCFPSFALAWGPSGHRVIAEIAEQHLTEDAAEAVKEILGEETLADVSTWADEVRDERPETAPWHYINPSGDSRRVKMSDCPDEGCVISAIVDQAKILKHRRASQAQKAEAIRWVVHMVGDVHQPMHVSRREDLGGNTIDVIIEGQTTNLHRAWDSGIMRLRNRGWEAMTEVLLEEITEDDVKDWSKRLDPTVWATESYEHAMTFAYKIPRNGELDEAYLDQAQNILDERMKMAGVRLGLLLNKLLD